MPGAFPARGRGTYRRPELSASSWLPSLMPASQPGQIHFIGAFVLMWKVVSDILGFRYARSASLTFLEGEGDVTKNPTRRRGRWSFRSVDHGRIRSPCRRSDVESS